MLFPKVVIEDIELNTDIGKTKARFDRKNRDFSLDGEEVTAQEEPKTAEEHIQDNSHREKFDPESKTLDFRGLKPTEVKNCPRIHVPGPRSQKEELGLSTKQSSILR